MKLNERIAHQTAGTTLNPVLVKGFFQTVPHYYQWGLTHQIDQRSLAQLNATDLFEFYLRFYLTSRHKTLQAFLREVRAFVKDDANAAHHLIVYSLEDTRQHLLTLEWYELLPRLEGAREQILALIPDVADQVRPRVVDYLKTFY
ncbi:MAG: hypothetical protein EOO39_31770 [Cytophagaceae bacterium]|nr:MAG: hypothetical protein EOO39_31770 [Cytophagaceae bacterium]